MAANVNHITSEGTYQVTKTLDWGAKDCPDVFRTRQGLLGALDRTIMNMGNDVYAFYAYGMEKKQSIQSWRLVTRYMKAIERSHQCCTWCETDNLRRETIVNDAAKHALQKYIVKWQ
jgi:hypothetical protein